MSVTSLRRALLLQCAVSLTWLLDDFLKKKHPEVMRENMTAYQVVHKESGSPAGWSGERKVIIVFYLWCHKKTEDD